MPEEPRFDEVDILERARQGSEEALQTLLRPQRAPALARIGRSLHPTVRGKVDPEDVLQEALLIVARRIPEFRGRTVAAFSVWFRRIVDHKIRETQRLFLDASRRSAKRELPRGARPNTSRFANPGPTPSQVAMGEELALRARAAFSRLSADHQSVLRLAQVENADLRTIAATLRRSYEATKKLYARAIRRFHELLQEEDRDER